jgi:prenylated cyclic peptide (anacyclamide/piricyclamide family)
MKEKNLQPEQTAPVARETNTNSFEKQEGTNSFEKEEGTNSFEKEEEIITILGANPGAIIKIRH